MLTSEQVPSWFKTIVQQMKETDQAKQSSTMWGITDVCGDCTWTVYIFRTMIRWTGKLEIFALCHINNWEVIFHKCHRQLELVYHTAWRKTGSCVLKVVSVKYRLILSADISTDMSVDTRLILGRYIGRVSVDGSVDTRPRCMSVDRVDSSSTVGRYFTDTSPILYR